MTPGRNPVTSCVSIIPWASFFATGVSLGGCILFCVFFVEGLDGFLFQLNTMANVVPSAVNDAVRSTVVKLGTIFCASALIFFVISVFVTSALGVVPSRSVDDLNPKSKPLYFRILSSRRTVVFCVLFAHTVLLLWLLILCGCAMVLILYTVYFGAMTQFCSLLNDQCFDFKVLYPIVRKLTSNKVNLVLCKEKKEILCDSNYLGDLIVAFFCCILALIGVVHFLMCMSANFARLSSRQAVKKGEHYAMNTGTVDSDSIIVHHMGK